MAQCQCTIYCKRPVKPGTHFCEFHNAHGCPRKSPLSGYEPIFNPDIYNTDKTIRHSHNCFAYAFSVLDKAQIAKCAKTDSCNVAFHGPGIKSGYGRLKGEDGKTCADTMARTLADSDGGYAIGFTGRCRRGFSKIATVVDPDADFHYYRQDKPRPGEKDSRWSHKPGATPVTDLDSNGNPIYDPALAGRRYPVDKNHDHELDYTGFCGYYCIPRDKKLTIASGGSSVQKATRKRKSSRHKTRRQVR